MTSFLTCFTKILTVSNFVIFVFVKSFIQIYFISFFSSFSQSFLQKFSQSLQKTLFLHSVASSLACARSRWSLASRRFSALTLSSLYVSLLARMQNPYVHMSSICTFGCHKTYFCQVYRFLTRIAHLKVS